MVADPRADPRARVRVTRSGHAILTAFLNQEIPRALRERRAKINAEEPKESVELMDAYLDELRRVQKELTRTAWEQGWTLADNTSP